MLALLLLFLVPVSCQRPQRKPPSFPNLPTIKELVATAGYETTDVEVITEDGYSLWMHRLGNNNGPPVIVHHGVFLAADGWVTRGSDKDLVYYLLREGYDVWLTNQRGTVYNEYNVYYNHNDPQFWDFSFHEGGFFDLPAFIDSILQFRKTSQLFFIGHSLGTTTFLVMASMRPEYNSKIRAAILLCPVAFTPTKEERSLFIQFLLPQADFLYVISIIQNFFKVGLAKAGIYELLPRTISNINAIKKFCGRRSRTLKLCRDLYGLYVGENRSNLNTDAFVFSVPYLASGTSSKTMLHIAQLYRSGEFKQFDYGKEGNLKKYGATKPPAYRLDLITTPVALIWGRNDLLAPESAVNKLANSLPNLIFSKPAPDPKYTHADIYLGDNANEIVFPDVIAVLKKLT